MERFLLVVLVGMLSGGCVGSNAGLLVGDLNSQARVSFAEGDSEASGSLLAFDPTRHRMEIVVTVEGLETTDDLAVVIITEAGSRYQILGSFHRCRTEGDRHECDRWLPTLPAETVGGWRVEARRTAAATEATVEVDVTWIPVG